MQEKFVEEKKDIMKMNSENLKESLKQICDWMKSTEERKPQDC